MKILGNKKALLAGALSFWRVLVCGFGCCDSLVGSLEHVVVEGQLCIVSVDSFHDCTEANQKLCVLLAKFAADAIGKQVDDLCPAGNVDILGDCNVLCLDFSVADVNLWLGDIVTMECSDTRVTEKLSSLKMIRSIQ